MAMVCAALMEKTLSQALSICEATDADIVEARLDFLDDLSDLSMLSDFPKPVIATCMPESEGGVFTGSESERVKVLKMACGLCSHVSIEVDMDPSLRQELLEEARGCGCKAILTHHDFERTPSVEEMVATLQKMQELGADIAKIAYTPSSKADALDVMVAVERAALKIDAIALSMGELGSFTRVLGPMLGGYLSFAAVDGSKRTAPGQLTVDEMLEVKRLLW